MQGYEALRQKCAYWDVSACGKIRATGEDRARLLHAMTTNNVQALKPGEGCYAFFLTAQGRILADVVVLCFDDHLLLITEPETRSKVYAHLDHFIIADDVTLEDLSDSLAMVAVEGPLATEALARAGAPVPPADYSHAAWGDRIVVRNSFTGIGGFSVIVPAADRGNLLGELQEAGCELADEDAVRAVRLENGKPRYGEDISDRYLVQETSQMHAVSFSKGCYLGQEIVERVRSRAQIHRRLLHLRVDSTAPPEPGTKFQANGKDAAEVTSSAWSPASGCSFALAYVRIDSKPGDTLTAGDVRATVL